MLFGYWQDVRKLFRSQGVPSADADAKRDEITTRALGELKSWSYLSEEDVDQVKAALIAILAPDDILPQIDAEEQPRKRRERVLKELLQKLEKPHAYAEAIARRMHGEGKVTAPDLRGCSDQEFDEILTSLRAQVRRQSKREKADNIPF